MLDARVRQRLGRALAPSLRALARRSRVPTRGVVRLPGLRRSVTIHHDAFAIPHLRASSDADLFRAQGFQHALHRMFQMDMLRRVLSGRLAETVGDRALPPGSGMPYTGGGSIVDADRFMRTLDLVGAARRVYAAADAEGRALLRAYAEGVNSALRILRRRRPIEYRALRLPLRDWHPVDTVIVAKGMALGLSFKWRTAPVFAGIARVLADAPLHLEQILPQSPGLSTSFHGQWVGSGPSASFAPREALPHGSNAFLVGGARTASGAPILASDPHLELQLPSVWYLASLHGARYRAVGCSLPGVPGVIIGRTPSLAWGLTNGMLDDGDFWAESLDAAGRTYLLDGKRVPLHVESQVIRRRGGPPQMMTLRRTHRGPLLSDAWGGRSAEHGAYSFRLTLHDATRDLESFLGLARSSTVAEGLAATDAFGAPAQNLILADTNGAAAFRMMGRVPIRGGDGHPALPRDGRTRANDWTGVSPASANPATSLGKNALFVTANQAHAETPGPAYISNLYEPDHRARRIQALLEGSAQLTAADLQAAQTDARNVLAGKFREEVLGPHAEAVRRMRPHLAGLVDRLLSYDGDERPAARGGVLWHLVFHHLTRRVFAPKLGPQLVDAWRGLINLVEAALRRAFREDDSPWAPPAVRATLIAEAIDDARTSLEACGLTADAPWGAWHTLTLAHPLGSEPALRPLVNRGPMPAPGSPFTPNSGQYRHARPGPMVVGASYRHVVDLGRISEAQFVTFGGQSGNPGSRHYDDLTPLWLAGEALPMRLEEPPRDRTPLRLDP